MIDLFIKANTPIEDIPKALTGLPHGFRVQVRNGGATEVWQHTAKGWRSETPGMTLYKDLTPEYIEFYGFVNTWGKSNMLSDALSLRLTDSEAKIWLASMERHQYCLEDRIGCLVDVILDDRKLRCASAMFSVFELKQSIISPGTAVNDKILAWINDMLKAGADAIDVCISAPK